ncbi:MAG: SDR family NAD(P)-dependent oxidoreductase [Spirochaetales bacterium]|nr:SDR family NAD(P)-dependent oxidoreductase [Spirochaetales bacterium]
MKKYIRDHFLVQSKLARKLYHEYAEHLPVIDFHTHLPSATTQNEFINEDNFKQARDTFFGLGLGEFKKVHDLNFMGTVTASYVFAADMIQQKRGAILNISSMSAYRPLTKIPAYSAAKSAVNNFTRWLAVHLAKVSVRVNALAPGFLLTDQNRFLLPKKPPPMVVVKKMLKKGWLFLPPCTPKGCSLTYHQQSWW